MQECIGCLAVGILLASGAPAQAQDLPVAPQRPTGLAISPVYEGWYPNPDGSYTLSFGYINRNTEEVLDIPVGPENHLEGGTLPQGLPTHFLPWRRWGVFAVRVPADFGEDQEVVWTLNIRGHEFAIPARLNRLYRIDALGAPATGQEPVVLKLAMDGPEARGPRGTTIGPLEATVGTPLPLSAWANDVDEAEEEEPLTLWWYKWSGPGPVTFSKPEVPVDTLTGKGTTMATFSQPGDYVVYVRTNASNDGGAGHEQCCWTNGYIEVTVTR